ncbi:hypothetical protein ACOMHN_021903 [Nucella lapillus]
MDPIFQTAAEMEDWGAEGADDELIPNCRSLVLNKQEGQRGRGTSILLGGSEIRPRLSRDPSGAAWATEGGRGRKRFVWPLSRLLGWPFGD